MAGAVRFQETTERSAAWIVRGNPKNVYRLVGYLEYGRSLYLLDELLNRVSAAELKVIEELIAERPEFTVYSNLSRFVEPQPTSLSERVASGAGAGSFRQTGLAWLMALARVELGAMAAGFDLTERPFEAFPPSRHDAAPYALTLMDALRTHYWALQRDPIITGDIRAAGLTDFQALAYARRVAVALEMVDALEELGKGRYSPEQSTQLAAWKHDLQSLKGIILYEVIKIHDTTTIKRQWSNMFSACPRLRQIAREDLANGTALVNGQPVTPEQGQMLLDSLEAHQPRTEVEVRNR